MKRLVIKVGTAVLTEDNKKLALDRIQNLVKLIAKLKNEKNIELICKDIFYKEGNLKMFSMEILKNS